MTHRQPNTFLIGAPKCGTTSVAAWLAQHPQVFMSDPKEPYTLGSDIEGGVPEGRYLDLFRSAPPAAKIIAEGSTWYLWSRDAIDRIEREFPGAKYIACLRNPVDMAWSLHGQEVFNLREPLRSFADAWAAQDARARGEGLPAGRLNTRRLIYREACALGGQMDALLEKVDRQRIHIIFLEDIAKRPQHEWTQLQNFLEVESFIVDLSPRNTARERRSQTFAKLVHLAGPIKRSLGLAWISLGVANHLNKANYKKSVRSPMPMEARRLVELTLKEEVARIEQIRGCPFSSDLVEATRNS